ncbi:MAG: prephenate/arogenate dehydrogenase family protein [Alphaproteobacteria bacterium]|nr:prephenate/arogenate dehydrogenase family protein [Alphaproteobacteria bacterium]MCD8571522.1 prephenate/arogenate dehydrogenase family protein [Alphaproteobacteria bacterium]
MFKKISIIGLGLIGSSLARITMNKQLAETLVAVDINPKVCDKVRELGIAHEATTSLSEGVKNSDLVILCVPVGAMGLIGEAIAPFLKDKAIVTDVGSVKQAVIDALKPHLPQTVELVPGHPIAGTEHSGPESGFPELFEGRWTILTPLHNTSVEAIDKVSAFWQECGAKIEIMEAAHHDLILGITSHLPHLIAYTIVGTADNLEDDIKSEVIKYSASGFRGFTRIAASDPTMWRDVFLNNKRAVLEILQRFSEDLSTMQKAIRQGDGDALFEAFSRSRQIRKQIMEMGPEGYPSPERVKTGRD